MTAITVKRYADIEAARDAKLAEINQAVTDALATLTARYPRIERESWTQQAQEARARAANPRAPSPLLDAIAAARGVSLATLIAAIIARKATYDAAAGAVFGKRQKLKAQIDSAASVREVALITWS